MAEKDQDSTGIEKYRKKPMFSIEFRVGFRENSKERDRQRDRARDKARDRQRKTERDKIFLSTEYVYLS